MHKSFMNRINMAASQLFTNEVTDPRLLEAMIDVPREMFVPANLQASAYVDEDLDVGNGRFLMAPITFARLLALAEITPSCRVLNIGSLSGYTAAVLGILAGHVVATEIDQSLVQQTVANLAHLRIGDVDVQQVPSLAEGYGLSAPYDVIVISGAIEFIPKILETQLALTGRLVAVRQAAARPGNRGGLGKGILAKRVNNQLQFREYFDAPASLLPGFERKSGFTL